MSDYEVDELVDYLARNPMAGDVVKGTGGCRKLGWTAPGRGESGVYRTMTFYNGGDLPVFLITMFSKGERVDLSQGERALLAALSKELVEEYAQRVVAVGQRR